MSARDIEAKLSDARNLLALSEQILEDWEDIPLVELPRLLINLRKNIRDAKKLVDEVGEEFAKMVKEVDEADVKDLLVDMEIEEQRRYEEMRKELLDLIDLGR